MGATMAERVVKLVRGLDRDGVADVVGGAWIALLLLGLMHLPALVS